MNIWSQYEGKKLRLVNMAGFRNSKCQRASWSLMWVWFSWAASWHTDILDSVCFVLSCHAGGDVWRTGIQIIWAWRTNASDRLTASCRKKKKNRRWNKKCVLENKPAAGSLQLYVDATRVTTQVMFIYYYTLVFIHINRVDTFFL